jgi:hypothetical protein
MMRLKKKGMFAGRGEGEVVFATGFQLPKSTHSRAEGTTARQRILLRSADEATEDRRAGRCHPASPWASPRGVGVFVLTQSVKLGVIGVIGVIILARSWGKRGVASPDFVAKFEIRCHPASPWATPRRVGVFVLAQSTKLGVIGVILLREGG